VRHGGERRHFGDNAETQFKNCAPCHDVGEKAKSKLGPVLNGLDGRKSGTIANFKYSEANKNSGIVWDETQFLEYSGKTRRTE
jgi:cytochrome c